MEATRTSAKNIAILNILLLLVFLSGIVRAGETDVRKMVPHMSAYEALELFKSGRLILLDVHHGRTQSEILGAICVPAEKISRVKLKIPEDKTLGVFCN